jgi:hypothetical protein
MQSKYAAIYKYMKEVQSEIFIIGAVHLFSKVPVYIKQGGEYT